MRNIAPPQQRYWKERYAEMLENATETGYSDSYGSAPTLTDELVDAIWRAWALMDNGENAPDPCNSVCGSLPAGGVECERKADEVRDILRAALAKATPPPADGEAG